MDEEYEFESELLTLIDDDGNIHEFEIIDELEIDEGHFLALVPTRQTPEEIAANTESYYIFETVEGEDGEEELEEVENDELANRLMELFEARFNDFYYDGDEAGE